MSLTISFISKFALSRIFTQILAVVATLASARLLGPEAHGEVATSLSIAAVGASLAGLSIGQAIHYPMQLDQNNSSSLLIGTLFTLSIILGWLGSLAGLITYFFLGIHSALPVPMLCAAMALIPIIIWEDYLVNITSKMGRLRELLQFQLTGRLTTLFSMALLIVVLNLGSQGAIYSYVIGELAVFIYSALMLVTNHAKCRLRLALSLAVSAKWLHFNTLSSLALGQANVLILAYFGDKRDVAYYTIANQMIGILLWLPQAIVTVSYAGIADSNPNAYWPTQRKLIIIGLFVTGCGGIVSWLLAPRILPLIAGHGFLQTAFYFRKLLPCLLGMSIALFMTPQWISRGLFRQTALITFIVGLVSLMASIFAAKTNGLEGIIKVNLVVYAGIVPATQLAFAIWCELRSRKFNRIS